MIRKKNNNKSKADSKDDAVKKIPKWAKNQVELGECINKNRRWIIRALKDPRLPKECKARSNNNYDVGAWLKFAGLEIIGDKVYDEQTELKLEEQVLKNQKLQIQIDKLHGRLVTIQGVQEAAAEVAQVLMKHLKLLPSTLPPLLEGRTIEEMGPIILKQCNKIATSLNSSFQKLSKLKDDEENDQEEDSAEA